jgi:hypothetical protein
MAESKLIASNEFEEIVERDGRYFVKRKMDVVCVIPYTIEKGMLEKVGVIKFLEKAFSHLPITLMSGEVNEDDGTNLVTANRILFENVATNVANANLWMYLGKIRDGLMDENGMSVYCVNVSDVNLGKPNELNRSGKGEFTLVGSNEIVSTDDSVLLAAYLRLFQFFYINSLNK